MARACLLLLAAWTPLQTAFHAALPRGASLSARAPAATMGSAVAVEKKAKVVAEVVDTMQDAMMMWCVRSESITVNDMNMMRQKFPEGVTIRCVKNTLVKRAAEEVPRFQGGDSLLAYSNYWFFVPEEHVRVTYDTWNDWVKETKNVRSASLRTRPTQPMLSSSWASPAASERAGHAINCAAAAWPAH